MRKLIRKTCSSIPISHSSRQDLHLPRLLQHLKKVLSRVHVTQEPKLPHLTHGLQLAIPNGHVPIRIPPTRLLERICLQAFPGGQPVPSIKCTLFSGPLLQAIPQLKRTFLSIIQWSDRREFPLHRPRCWAIELLLRWSFEPEIGAQVWEQTRPDRHVAVAGVEGLVGAGGCQRTSFGKVGFHGGREERFGAVVFRLAAVEERRVAEFFGHGEVQS